LCAQQIQGGRGIRNACFRLQARGIDQRSRVARSRCQAQCRRGSQWYSGPIALPKQIDAQKIIAAIDPAKDVDGFHLVNEGRLASGLPALVPCTPMGWILAKTIHDTLAGLEAVVAGRSNIVGKPVAQLLLAENATVTITHSRTNDVP